MKPSSAFLCLSLALFAPLTLEAEIGVQIEAPPRAPAFGMVEVAASIDRTTLAAGDSIASVSFFVDDREIGTLEAPPWEMQIDVGQDNRERTFRVEARSALGDSGHATLETPAIRVDMEITLELQQLYVTVMAAGQRVPGLSRDDFRILDDGAEQSLVTFEGGDVPIVAALLLDTSASMEGAPLEAALRGGRTFIAGMKELDRVAAYLFSDRLRQRTPWSGDPSILEKAMEELDAQGNTAIWDVLFRALENLDARQGRRVAVLLTDGADLHSALGMEEVLWKLRRTSTALYWLRLEGAGDGSFRTSWRNEEENRKELAMLEEAVTLSGGRILDIESLDEVEPAFVELLAELREQYVLGYYPSNKLSDGSWREVTVRVRGRGSVARSRTGYVDD